LLHRAGYIYCMIPVAVRNDDAAVRRHCGRWTSLLTILRHCVQLIRQCELI